MKKFIKYFSFLLVLLIVVTGCGEKKEEESKKKEENKPENAEQLLTDAVTKMNEVKSSAMSINMELVMEMEGSSITMAVSAKGEVDENEVVHMITEISTLGFTQAEESYTLVKDGYSYTYTKDPTYGWYYEKEEATEEDGNGELIEQEELEELLNSFTSVKEVETDKEGYTKLIATINKDKFSEIMNSTEGGEEIQVTVDFDMTIYLKDGYVSIIELDLSDLMSSALTDAETGASMGLKMSMEFTDFNAIAPIELPAELENAVAYDELQINVTQ